MKNSCLGIDPTLVSDEIYLLEFPISSSENLKPCSCKLEDKKTGPIYFGKDAKGYYVEDTYKDTFRVYVNDILIPENKKYYFNAEKSFVLRVGNVWFEFDMIKGEIKRNLGGGAALKAKNVHFKQKRKQILNDFSTNIQPNEFACLIGPSGCGKTTLIKLIAGHFRKSEGLIELNKKETKIVRNKNIEFNPKIKIGYVPQFEEMPLNLKVIEIMKFRTIQRGYFNFSDLELEEHLNKIGLEKLAGNKIKSLSGGQKRRLSVSLEVLFKPELLLLDEPFAGLDPHSEEVMLNYLKLLRSHTTVICSTHVFANPDIFDQVIIMRKGKNIFQGYVFLENNKLFIRNGTTEVLWRNKLKEIYA